MTGEHDAGAGARAPYKNGSDRPGIDELHATVLEIGGVARHDSGPMHTGDGCDHQVGHRFDRPARKTAQANDFAESLGCEFIKGEGTVGQVQVENSCSLAFQPCAPPSRGQYRHAGQNFGLIDGGGVQQLPGLASDLGRDFRRRRHGHLR